MAYISIWKPMQFHNSLSKLLGSNYACDFIIRNDRVSCQILPGLRISITGISTLSLFGDLFVSFGLPRASDCCWRWVALFVLGYRRIIFAQSSLLCIITEPNQSGLLTGITGISPSSLFGNLFVSFGEGVALFVLGVSLTLFEIFVAESYLPNLLYWVSLPRTNNQTCGLRSLESLFGDLFVTFR